MGSIYLIRHGQASFGADDYDVLSATGVRQAQVLGEHLAGLGLRLDRCLAGDLQRQRHTASEALGRMREAGLDHIPVVVGGIISPEDELVLKNMGVRAVYTPKDYAIDRIMVDLAKVIEKTLDGKANRPQEEPAQVY